MVEVVTSKLGPTSPTPQPGSSNPSSEKKQARQGGATSAAATIKSSLSQQNEAGNRLSELGETLQQDKVVEAEAKVENFKKFKKEVVIAVCKAQLQVNEIR